MGQIIVEQHGPVLLGILDNPPHALMDQGTVDALDALVARAESEDDVRGVVLTGSRPDRFVAHYDIAEILGAVEETPAVGRRTAGASLRAARAVGRVPGLADRLESTPVGGLFSIERFHGIFDRMNRCGAVFVAAINGSTQGGGCELSLACDLRLMAAGDHVIGQPEILFGFPPGGGGTQRLPRLLGSARALRICLDGTPITPEQALEIGLIDEIVDTDELHDRAIAEAGRLGARAKAAIAALKRSIYEGGSLPLAEGLHNERAEFMAVSGSEEAKQAMRRYLEELQANDALPAYDRDAIERADAGGGFGSL